MDKILTLLENDAKLTPEQLAAMLSKEVGEIRAIVDKYEKEGVIVINLRKRFIRKKQLWHLVWQ